jgi:hypothetical protein
MSFSILQPTGRATFGTPPVFVAADRFCTDCGRRHDFERCPKCAAWISFQYGIHGLMHYCYGDDCEWIYVVRDHDWFRPAPKEGSGHV